MNKHRHTTARVIVAAMVLVAALAPPAAAQWKKLPDPVIQQKVATVVTDSQRIRNIERDAIDAFIASLKASVCVKSHPQGLPLVGSFGLALMNSRTKADQSLPNELGSAFRGFLSIRPAPPIPGKQGELNGESKINEHFIRETNDSRAAGGGISQLMGCPEVKQTQPKLDALRNQAKDALLNMMRNATQNAFK